MKIMIPFSLLCPFANLESHIIKFSPSQIENAFFVVLVIIITIIINIFFIFNQLTQCNLIPFNFFIYVHLHRLVSIHVT